MKKIFLVIIVVILCCLWLACREGVTDASGIAVFSKNIDVGLPTQGLIAYYPFNNNTDDASGNGNNGTNYDATLTTDRFGHRNNAYDFEPRVYEYGNGPHITIPELLSDSCSSFTFCFWIQRNLEVRNAQYIFFKSPNNGHCGIYLESGFLHFYVYLKGNLWYNQKEYSIESTNPIELGKYYFITCRYRKGQKIDLMINGVVNSYLNIPNADLDSRPYYNSMIGTRPDDDASSFHGIIDDVRLYDRALSDTGVVSLFHEGGWTGN